MGVEPAKPVLLIAEDDTSIALIMKDYFEKTYDVRMYDSGEALLAALREEGKPAAFLTDYGLAGEMNGLELIQEARKLYADIPFVMLSASTDAGLGDTVRNSGGKFVRKPASFREVEAALNELLGRQEVGRTPMDHAKRPPERRRGA